MRRLQAMFLLFAVWSPAQKFNQRVKQAKSCDADVREVLSEEIPKPCSRLVVQQYINAA
jgi:hypothetical protein